MNTTTAKIILATVFTLGLALSAMQSSYAESIEESFEKKFFKMMDEKKNLLVKELENNSTNIEKIKTLQTEYWQVNEMLNTMIYVEPKRDFLAEWEAKEKQIKLLEESLQQSNKFDEFDFMEPILEKKIQAINDEIFVLEEQSIASMILDEKTKKHLETIETEIFTSYPDIYDIGIDSEQKKVLVLVDYENPDHVKSAQSILEQFGTNNVIITPTTPTACASTTSNCDPLLGGLAIKRANEPSNRGYSGSIGYKAKDTNNNIGFVTAGHVVEKNGVDIMLYDGTSIGVSSNYHEKTKDGGYDVAFVKTTKISDDIFKSSNRTLDISSYATSNSSHNAGNFIYFSGATSNGEERSKIKLYTRSGVVLFTDNYPTFGDSGGTVYDKDRRGKIKLMGHITNNNIYVPVHVIKNSYNITPQLR